MKKILAAVIIIMGTMTAKAQFPTTDSLERFINRYIRNSAVEAFQNLRLNTALIGMTKFIDSAYGGQIVSVDAPTDSTLRIITLGGDTVTITIRGTGGGVASIKSSGSGYSLVLPSDTIRSVRPFGAWIAGDTTTNRTEFRLTVIPQAGDGLLVDPFTDAIKRDTTRNNGIPTRYLIDSLLSRPPPLATQKQINSLPYLFAWGNSLTASYGSTVGNTYPILLSRISGYSVGNGGVSGETSYQILQRILAADSITLDKGQILWMGRNDFLDSNGVLRRIDSAVQKIGHNRFIVLSIINGAYTSEQAGTAKYFTLKYVNDSLQRKYGSRYKDVRTFLVNSYNPLIPQDVIDHANDVPPSSLRVDELHLNDSGYKKVAEFVAANMSELLRPDTAFPTSKLSYVFINPPPIGLNGGNIIRGTSIGAGKYPGQLMDIAATGWYGINGSPAFGKKGNNFYMGGVPDFITSDAEENIFIGNQAGEDVTTNDYSVGIGYRSQYQIEAGLGNTSLGYLTLTADVTGPTENTAIGYRTMNGGIGSENTAVGSQSMGAPTGSFNTAMGVFSLAQLTSGLYNTSIGYYAGRTHLNASRNTLVGTRAGENIVSGTNNVGVGYWALRNTGTNSNSTAVGFEALMTSTTGGMTAVGSRALRNTTGINNVAFGTDAGLENTTGVNNTFMGYLAGQNNNTGGNNTAVGQSALKGNSGISTINSNTAIGSNAGVNLTGGADKNIFIGVNSGTTVTTGSSNIYIGYKITGSTTTDIGRLSIGNLIFGTGMDSLSNISTGSVGIRTRTPEQALHIRGQLKIDTLTTGASSDSLVVTAGGVLKKILNNISGSGITELTGDVTAGPGSGSVATTIAANAVTNSKFRQSAGLSIIGNNTNATANVDDITATSDHQVLRRSGTGIAFGSINLASSAAVTGILPIANGGTGLSALGTANQQLRVNSGGTALEYFTPSSASVSNDAYSSSWNGVTTTAPSQNAVYDKFESLIADSFELYNANGRGFSILRDVAPNESFLRNLLIRVNGTMADTSASTDSTMIADITISGAVSGTGTSGRVAFWNGTSSLSSDANFLYGSSTGLSIGTTNTQGRLNLGGNKDLASSGVQSYFAAATYNDATTAASGTASSFGINYIAEPTISATNASVTFPNIATLLVDAPVAGPNATITNGWAIETGVNGNVRVGGNLVVATMESGGTPPTISGASKPVVVDANGLLTSKTIGSTASSATPTPDASNYLYRVTALATNATFGAPTGTPVDGQDLLVRIKDDGTSRTLGWNAAYRAGTDFALPTATTINKTVYIQFVYNAADSKWDAVGLTQGF